MAYTSKMAERGIKTTLNSATMSAVADLSGISTSQYYTQRTISDRLNPYQVMRECVDAARMTIWILIMIYFTFLILTIYMVLGIRKMQKGLCNYDLF